MTQELLLQKLQTKFNTEHFTIVKYGINSADTTEAICQTCGRHIISNTGELLRARRKYLCAKCNTIRKDSERNRQIIAKQLQTANVQEYEFYFQASSTHPQSCVWICPLCNRANDQLVSNMLRAPLHCAHCKGGRLQDTNDLQRRLDKKYPENFLVLSTYQGVFEQVKIKCRKCGMIRKVAAQTILAYGHCPKCGKIKSKAKQKIQQWLEMKNISFSRNYYFKEWNNILHYYDFYVPEYNLVLEYHGKQHYESNDFFHYNPARDQQKKELALRHGINYCSIKYTLYDNLEEVLQYVLSSTTIPQGSRGLCLEIETVPHRDKDIV